MAIHFLSKKYFNISVFTPMIILSTFGDTSRIHPGWKGGSPVDHTRSHLELAGIRHVPGCRLHGDPDMEERVHAKVSS